MRKCLECGTELSTSIEIIAHSCEAYPAKPQKSWTDFFLDNTDKSDECDHIYDSYCHRCGIDSDARPISVEDLARLAGADNFNGPIEVDKLVELTVQPVVCGDCLRPECKGCGR